MALPIIRYIVGQLQRIRRVSSRWYIRFKSKVGCKKKSSWKRDDRRVQLGDMAHQSTESSSRLKLQKWRSILVVGALMVTGCILLLHLNVVDSLSSYQTREDVQGQLPHLPALGLHTRTLDRENQEVGKNFREDGVPEAEMVGPAKGGQLLQVEEVLEEQQPRPNASWCGYQDLRAALEAVAVHREVFLQVIPDADHVILARNTLETFTRRLGKKNVLFVCRDVMQCEKARMHRISCYIDVTFPGSSLTTFNIISNILQMNYKVIHMDFDTSVIKELPSTLQTDMVIPYGMTPKAHSFYIANNKPLAVRLHKMAISDAIVHQNKTFAAVFKTALASSFTMKPALRKVILPGCSKVPNDPKCCLLRHPFFKTPEDRTLWLKEKQMWFYDHKGYYTSTEALYLSYENNFDMGKRTAEYSIHALKNALAYGHILNRTVILPKFLCIKCKDNTCKKSNCLLGGLLNMTRFDSVFSGRYREHSFKGHPLVPLSTKKNSSELLLVRSELLKGMVAAGGNKIGPELKPGRVIEPNNIHEGPDSDEVKDLFEGYTNKKILQFVNMYGAFSGFTSAKDSLEFEHKLKQGIAPLGA